MMGYGKTSAKKTPKKESATKLKNEYSGLFGNKMAKKPAAKKMAMKKMGKKK